MHKLSGWEEHQESTVSKVYVDLEEKENLVYHCVLVGEKIIYSINS